MKTVFVAAVSMLLLACTNGKPITETFVSADCGPVGGYTQTMVTYGDDGIHMKELSKVRVKSEFRIKLKPKPKKDWADNLVSVKGDTANSDAKADWIDGNGKEEDLSNGWFLAGCVPEVSVGTRYKFVVEVEGLEPLDPRAEVTD